MRTCFLALLLTLMMASTAGAGDYHSGAGLICAECHVMHYSQAHGYNADGTGDFTALGASGPYKYLLRDDVNALCLACHDGQGWAPDVLAAGTTGDIRQGGALSDLVGAAPYEAGNGHTIGSVDAAPGSSPVWSPDPQDGLVCTDCHEQHGYNPNGNPFRNLMHDAGNYAPTSTAIVTYASGTNNLAMDVFESGDAAYDISEVWFNEPSGTESSYAVFCKGCHTDFHGAKGGLEVGGATGIEWVRHPNADADIGAEQADGVHSSIELFASRGNKVKVMSPTGVWESLNPDDLADSTPTCVSCHKGHGNQNAFGLIYMAGTGVVTEEGDSGTQAKHLCGQCHVQG